MEAKHPGLTRWLADGDRGVSSNTIVHHLTGLPTLRGWPPSVPWDPDDLDRCLQLLEEVPSLRPLLPKMANCSPQWAALINRWDEIEASHLDEVGLRWTKARSAPRTYRLMKEAIASSGLHPAPLPDEAMAGEQEID